MSRFDAMLESIFIPASDEEVARRSAIASAVISREWKENFLLRNDVSRNPDGSYDVDGSVNIIGMGLDRIPVKFGRVSGSFMCSKNRLTGLENAPSEVGGIFACEDNPLTSLEHFPRKVGSHAWVGGTAMENLTPEEVRSMSEIGGTLFV